MFGEQHQHQHLLRIILLEDETRRTELVTLFWETIIILELYNVFLTTALLYCVWVYSILFHSIRLHLDRSRDYDQQQHLYMIDLLSWYRIVQHHYHRLKYD